MAKNNETIFQRLTNVVIGTGKGASEAKRSVSYNIQTPQSEVLYTFDNKEARDQKLLQLKQQKLLSYQWRKNGYESSMAALAGATQVKVMYRDVDLMDQWPDINSALYIMAEEATTIKKGKMLNVYSKSERIKAILEDLFLNRLNVNNELKMIVRDTCKYGNEFMFLNIDEENGVIGWRRLDVYNMRRIENGMESIYGGPAPSANLYNLKPDEVKFVWEGHNDQTPYKNWQVAHFRLIDNSLFLPYGVSVLNGARRHWRMLSMLEDAIFLHRLERSVERRIFKVNVGNIDEADVPAYLQEFANNFKRAPIVDPKTGQVDLRKNYLDVSTDYFIPVRPGQDPSSIETLNAAQVQNGMEDIEYFEKKILAILRVPKTFLNYTEAQGKGQNLSLMDIRFSRMINSIQETILMELTKIAIIHLYLLGFEDELTNFTLTLNNPSNQIELMELDNMTKRLNLASQALAEQGGGIPLMSWHDVQKEILGKTDAEISDILNQIRLETAIANELQLTPQIIQNTGLFKKVDRLYGEPGAKYQQVQPGEDGGFGGGPMGGGGGMPPMDGGFGDDMGDMGAPGDEGGDIGGDEGSTDLGDMGGAPDAGGAPLQENNRVTKGFVKGNRTPNIDVFKQYEEQVLTEKYIEPERPKIISKGLMINEELMSKLQELEKIHDDSENGETLED